MSWDVALMGKEGTVKVERHKEGGTICVGGTEYGEMNITYNYGEMFHFRKELDGKTAAETIPALEAFVNRWGTKRYSDYWAPTPGNIGHACNVLLGWARRSPDAVWSVR